MWVNWEWFGNKLESVAEYANDLYKIREYIDLIGWIKSIERFFND